MKRLLKIYGLLTLLILAFTSCEDDDFSFVIPEEQEVPSAKDNLPWPLTQYMDAENYRPGDDFYLYCNGKYWQNASMGNKRVVGFFDTEIPEALKQLRASVSNPVYDQLEAHGNVQVTNAQFYAFLKPFYKKIDGIQSYEDAFRVAGELIMAGTKRVFDVSPASDKTVSIHLETSGPFDVRGEHLAFLESDDPDDVYQYIATHPVDVDAEEAYYKQQDYWNEHEEESAEYEARADELLKKYLVPALGLKAEVLEFEDGFKNWLIIPLEELKAYLKMKVFQDFAPYANQQGFDFMTERAWPFKSPFEYASTMTGLLKQYLDDRLLIERYVSAGLKREVETLCEEIRDAFCTRIENLAWMSATTKANAIRKIKAIQFYVGYPDRWLADLPDISHCTNMLEDMQMIFKEYTLMSIKLAGSSKKENYMNVGVFTGSSLLEDTAFYDNDCNFVIIHAPFILPPMYEGDMHPAMKYGMLMSVIGHELTHAVSFYGSKYDENGKEIDWWTIQDRMEYEALQKRLVELYNRFILLPDYPDIHADGELTLDENIADLGGMEIAHDAFVAYCLKQGFKGEELDEMERKFFQGNAEYFRSRYGYDFYNRFKYASHAFDKERVNGVVMNMDRWYELFDVQWGDYLYLKPENRIHIW